MTSKISLNDAKQEELKLCQACKIVLNLHNLCGVQNFVTF